MDLKQLEAFVGVVKNQSFTKAAVELYLTQPTVSSHIFSLEKELGTQLLMRTTKEVKATQAGMVLFDYANEMLMLRDKAIADVMGYNSNIKGEITVAASSIPINYFLPKLIADFSAIYSDVSFNIISGDSNTVLEKMLDQKLDIAMVGTAINSKKFFFEPFAKDTLVVITPNNEKYQLMQKNGYSLAKLFSSPFITREYGSGTRAEAEYFMRNIGVDNQRLNIVAQMQDNEAIVRSVAQGAGIAIVSYSTAENFSQRGEVLIFNPQGKTVSRNLYLVKRKNVSLSSAALAFYEFSKKYYKV